MMTPRLLLLALLLAAPATAQVDPERRRLVQFGYDHPLSGPGPVGAYLFYYMNEPRFVRPDLTLRLAVAPSYLYSELGGHRDALDYGFGLQGGGFADSYYEVRGGHYFPEESFLGDGATASLSLYKRVNPSQELPLNLVARASLHRAVYAATADTRSDFQLPPDHNEQEYVLGARLGGVPPRLRPARAAELSIWYEPVLRDHSGDYGLGGDRRLERFSELYWARALAAYRLQDGRRFELSAEAGGSQDTDRLDAYRVGGMLPFASESPLALPGYYNGELTVSRYVLLGARLSGFFDQAQHVLWSVFANSADVTFLHGVEQPKPWNSSVGAGTGYESPGRILVVTLDYGYGIDAIRASGRGAHSVALLMQLDLEAWRSHTKPATPPQIRAEKPAALDWARDIFRW